jgi:uncharacterized phage infection (PIP) family protein YhgE
MEFKEFLAREEAKLFDSELDQIDEVLGTALKFLGGVGGNLASQVARGAGNAVSGITRTTAGTGQAALAALQAAGGGTKRAGETFQRARSNLSSGGGSIVRGAAQLAGALSGVSPILRGAQAASEPLGMTGVYAPGSKNRNFTQDLLGLDSWEKLKQQQPKTPPVEKPQDPAKSFLGDLEQKQKKEDIKGFKELVDQYRASKTRPAGERERIMSQIIKQYPKLYQQSVDVMQKRKNKTRV